MENTSSDYPGTAGETDTTSLVTEQVKQGTQQVVQQTQQAAGQAADAARGQAQSMFQSRKQEATGNLHQAADALRQTGETLRSKDQGAVANVTDSIADRLEGAAGYFEQRDLNDLIYEAEGFTRRNPAFVLGGAFLAGLAAARFLKSSSSQASFGRQDSARSYGGYQPYSGYRTYDSYGYGATPSSSTVSDSYPSRAVGSVERFSTGTGAADYGTDTMGLTEGTSDLETGDGTTDRPY